MSGAAYPRQTRYYRDAVIAARSVIERETTMRGREADSLAEAVAERLLGDFLAVAEESSWVAFTPEGTGPVCTWCGALAGIKAERERLAAVLAPAKLRLLADWFDADDVLKRAQFPTLDRGQTDEVQRDLRRFADLLGATDG